MATLKEVYNAFKTDGAPLPDTYEKFESYMNSGPNGGRDHRREWYDAFKADGAPLPDTYEDFERSVFGEQPEAEAQAGKPALQEVGNRAEAASRTAVAGVQRPWDDTRQQVAKRLGLQAPAQADGAQADGAQAGKPAVQEAPAVPVGYVGPMQQVQQRARQMAGRSLMPGAPVSTLSNMDDMLSGVKRPPLMGVAPTQQEVAEARHDAELREEPWPTEEVTGAVNEFVKGGGQAGQAQAGKPAVLNPQAGKPALQVGGRAPRPAGSTYENGRWVPQWELGDGRLTTNYWEADASERESRIFTSANMLVSTQLREAIKERERLQAKADARRRELDTRDRDFEEHPLVASIMSTGPANHYQDALLSDTQYQQYLSAIKEADERIRTLTNRRIVEDGGDVGFWHMFGQTLKDPDTWLMGITDLPRTAALLQAASSPDTESAQALMKQRAQNAEVQQTYGDFGFLARAGMMSAEMLPFMLQFAWTGGGYSGMNLFTRGAGRLAARQFGTAALKEMAETGLWKYGKKYGLRGVARKADNWLIRATGTTADELLVRAPLMTNTVQAAQTVNDIVDRKLGDVTVDRKGFYNFANDQSWGSAIWQAEANSVIENYSEMFGLHLEGAVPKLERVLGSSRMSGVLARAKKSDLGRIASTANTYLRRAGVSDYLGEVGEEYYGQLWRTMLDLDDSRNAEGVNLFNTGEFHGDIWGGMALSMGLIGAAKYTGVGAAYGVKKAVSGIEYAQLKHGMNKADTAARELFTAERWEPLRQQIEHTKNDEVGKLAEGIMADEELSAEEKEAAMTYLEWNLNWRGMNLGLIANSRDDGDTPDVRSNVDGELSASYMDGYTAQDEQEMADAQNTYNIQRERMEGHAPALIADLDADPVGTLLQLAQEGRNPETIDAARDYANAKQALDGIRQRMTDDVDELVAQSDMQIKGRVNTATGLIHPAKAGLDDHDVFIVGGNVTVKEDGTIDREKSDESLIVRDAQTGEMEFVDPKEIRGAGATLDPEAERVAAAEAIRQQAAEQAEAMMRGLLSFNPGDAVSIGDGAGGFVQGTIAGPVVDERTGAVLDGMVNVDMPDGSRQTLKKQDLQAWADAQARARAEEFDRARRGEQPSGENGSEGKPQFKLNDEFSIETGGAMPVRGSITAEADEDGLIEIHTEEPLNGQVINKIKPEELERMLVSYNSVGRSGAESERLVGIADVADGAQGQVQADDRRSRSAEQRTPGVQEGQQDDVGSVLERIPLNEKGKPDFGAVDADTAWDGLVEKTGKEELAQAFAENMQRRAEAEVKRLSASKTKSTDDIDEFVEAEGKRLAAVEQAKARLEHWKQVAGTKARREAEAAEAAAAEERRVAKEGEAAARREREEAEMKAAAEEADRKRLAQIDKRYRDVYDEVKDYPTAVERLEQQEPETIEEVASMVLSANKVLWGNQAGGSGAQISKGVRGETGFGEGERRKLFGLFASVEKGGQSIQRLAEDQMKQTCEMYGIAYDNGRARDALIDVIMSARTRSDITNYIRNRRLDQALDMKHQEQSYERREMDNWAWETFGMSYEEYEAYEDMRQAQAEERLANMNLKDLYAEATDELEAIKESEALRNDAMAEVSQERLENFDESDYFSNIAEENERDKEDGSGNKEKSGSGSRRSTVETVGDESDREGEGGSSGVQVLSGAQPAEAGGTETAGSRSDILRGDSAEVHNTPGAVASSASGRGIGPTVGPFGEVYTQFKGKPQEAVAFLLAKRGGEAIGALYHKEVGEIDLVWGEEGTSHSDGFGLAKLAKYHPEVLLNLQEILSDMVVTKRSSNRVQLESEKYKAAVRLTWDNKKKTWLLTMFEKKNSALDNTTDTDKTQTGNGNDKATPESTVLSDGKGSDVSGDKQEEDEKSSGDVADDLAGGGKSRKLDAEKELSAEEIDAIDDAAITDEVKDGARDWLAGERDAWSQMCYETVKNYVRNSGNDRGRGSRNADEAQLAGSVSDEEGAGVRGSGQRAVEEDRRGGNENVAGNGDDVADSPRGSGSVSGTGSTGGVEGSTSTSGKKHTGAGGSVRRGRTGRSRSDVRKQGGQNGGVEGPGHDGRGPAAVQDISKGEETAQSLIDEALDTFRDIFKNPGMTKPGRMNDVTTLLAGLGVNAARFLGATAKLGCGLVLKGYYKFGRWQAEMHKSLDPVLHEYTDLTDEQIAEYLRSAWDMKMSYRGQRKKVSEWAAELEVEELRKLAQMSIDEKRKAQAAAEGTEVKAGDLDNIRETLPFLLPAQHEDVEKAEKQFFSADHADSEHGYGKGYMFTNGTGTGKTYTGLGIVKRFLKQGKGRVLIVTVNDTKISDWIKDASNLGIKATKLADTKSKGSGVVVTQYANLRQNYALLEDAFDLIVYDESHKLMENQEGSEGSTAKMHHMLANRDAEAVLERELEVSELGKNRRAARAEVERLNELLSIAQKPLSMISAADREKIKESGFRSEEAIEQAVKTAGDKVDQYDKEFDDRIESMKQDTEALKRAEGISRKSKAVFLSATPFNTPSSLDYAEGYIFTYPGTKDGESRRDKRNKFLKDKFGKSYRRDSHGDMIRMSEGQISDPEGVEEQEISYSDYLQNTLHTKSGRMLDSAYDYSRTFPKFEMPEANLVNAAMSELNDSPLKEYFNKTLFDYNYSTAFWEIIKTGFAIERIKEHIALGRKVVVFHRRKASSQDARCPFAEGLKEAMNSNNKSHKRAAMIFAQKYKDLLAWEASLDYSYPQDHILREFITDEEKEQYEKEMAAWREKSEKAISQGKKAPKQPKMRSSRVGIFNGDHTLSEKQAAVDSFNHPESGEDVIVVQVQSGKEGISLHDTDGKHQRVMLSLALPQSPIEFIQAEGRIYRVGNQSDAIFEYPLLGIDRELYDFAMKINGRSQTSENLAMGSQSRGLRDSITRGALGSTPMPVSKDQGKGGKMVDSRKTQTATGFDHAMTNWKEWRDQEADKPYDERSIPDPLAVKLMEWAGLERGETVLVGYAGEGSAARYAPASAKLIALESDSGKLARLAALLGGGGRKILGEHFMSDEDNNEYSTVNKADVVVVKTRTGKKKQGFASVLRSQEDIKKALQHTEDSGRVIAIVPTMDIVGGLLAEADQWKRYNGVVIRNVVNLPANVFGEAASVIILDRNTEKSIKDAQAAKGIQTTDVAAGETAEATLAGMRDLTVEKREVDCIAKAVKRCKAVLSPFMNAKLVSSSGYGRSTKKTKDVWANRSGVMVRFTKYIVPKNGRSSGLYNGLTITFKDLSTPEGLEEAAKTWVGCHAYAEMDMAEFKDRLEYELRNEAQMAEAHDLMGHLCTLIEAATGKTATQLENLAEGRVENAIKSDMTIEEFKDVYKTLDSGSEEIDELARRVFAVAAKIDGLKFRMAGVESFSGHNVMAHYAPGKNAIELNSDAFNSIRFTDEQKAQCILHETIHAVTCWAVAKYKNASDAERESMGAIGDACADILNVYKAINTDSFRALLQTGSKLKDNANYGLNDEYEMLAEMANPVFRAALKAKRLWRQLINGIKKLFGIDVTESGEGETTAFEVLNNAMNTILENFDPEEYKRYEASPSKQEHQMETSDLRAQDGESVDRQGNPVNNNGRLIIERVESIDDITDADFIRPSRNIGLPTLPERVQQVLLTHGKPLIIKKNIFERNARRHSDLAPETSRAILREALYNPTIYGKNKPLTRPNNWIVINVPDGKVNNKLVVLEVNDNKDNVEIVHWHEVDDRGLEKIRKQAEREDGQLLILPSEKSEEAGALSGPTSGVLSEGKGTTFVTKKQETDTESSAQAVGRAQAGKPAVQAADDEYILFRPVTDEATLRRLDSEPTIKVYRAMQMIDGGLRPPMSAKVNGEMREATEIGVWEEAEEHPELADENGKFKLDKGNGESIKAAYNPYIHTSRSPINDQFSSAWKRPELVTVEVEIPASELTSGYQAEKAAKPVGELDWKSGPVSRLLAKVGQVRKVILSRWSRVVRVVPVEEVAEAYAQRLNAYGIEVPFNTVPPALRDALASRGVKIGNPEKGNAGQASMPAFERWLREQELERQGDGYGAYSDAEVSYLNDPVSKVMGKNRFSKKQQAEFAARERRRMAEHVQRLAAKLNLKNVEIVDDGSQFEGRRGKAKGFFNPRTGKITIVIANHTGTLDVEQTLLHEGVAHYGLRKLCGEHFKTFLYNVYDAAEPAIRRKIAALAAKNGWDFPTATEEYLAGLAEDMNFEEARNYGGWWSVIKGLFIDMLEKIGFEGFRDKTGIVLTDNELRYMLWRSYENLKEPGHRRSIFGEAEDVARQSDMKVGNYAEGGIGADYAAEPMDVEETNEKFNKELQQQIDGTLPEGHVYDMGMPSKYLLSTGIEKLPIKLSAKVLNVKSNLERHSYNLESVKDLVNAIQKPWAIFSYGDKAKAQNLIVGIEDNGRQFLVGISINPTVKGRTLEINSIRNVFPKNNHEWINWITEGKLLRVDGKEEIQAIIAKLRMNPVAFDYLNLDNAAKVVKEFENPTIEEEELFRDGDFTPRDKALARDYYERMCRKGTWQFREAVQDSMLGLKTLYQAVLGEKTHIEDVAGFENAYIFENRMSSANRGEQHEYFVRYMKPLLNEIGRICGANERKRRDLTDYMMAKHGLERNEHMRAEAKKFNKQLAKDQKNGERMTERHQQTDRDFAGLIGLTGEADWKSAEATARQWVDDYEQMVDTRVVWKAVNAATKATLEKMYKSGMLSTEKYEEIRDMYEYYIPLRGWDETTSDEVYGYLTSKNDPRGGSILKKAEGHSHKTDDPIATIAMMADDGIRQGNRNVMKQRFLNFVLNHPSDLVSVQDLWLEYNKKESRWDPVFAEIDPKDTAEEVEQKIAAFEERMKQLIEQEPDKYKRGREVEAVPYKVVKGNLREHQVLVKRNGRTYVLTINGNPRAAQAINGLTNPDVDQGYEISNLLKAAVWTNRQLSAFYTTRNPDFVVSNFFRDLLYSNCMTWVKEDKAYALKFHKNFAKYNPVTMYKLLLKWEDGKLDMNNKREKLFYDFMINGGETGYTNVRDIEKRKRDIVNELKKEESFARGAWAATGQIFDLMNRSAENCARFAAFVTSRECGRSIDRSIYDAKEVSVNFNKKGSGGKMVNAVGQTKLGKLGSYVGGIGRLGFVFWNAGLQGMVNAGRAAKRHPGKAAVAASLGLFSLGFVTAMLNAMFGGGDDDDQNAYYNLPDYIRRSNLCIRAGKQSVSIPLPIEFRALYGLGELAYGVMSGNERYSASELAYELASQVSQLLPLDVLEGGGGWRAFVPSIAKPLVEAYSNRSWTGLPIYRDSPFAEYDPQWTKAYANANTQLVGFAKWLNELTTGNDYKQGWLDINPARLEYLLKGYFGGVVTFPGKIIKSGETIFGDREFEWRNIPIANRLVKSGDERTAYRKVQNEYYKYKEEYEETHHLQRKYGQAADAGDERYARELEELTQSEAGIHHEIFEWFKKDIDAKRDEIGQAITPQEKKALEQEMYEMMKEMTEAMRDPGAFFSRMYDQRRINEDYKNYLEKNTGVKIE